MRMSQEIGKMKNDDLLSYFNWLYDGEASKNAIAKSNRTFAKKILSIRKKWKVDRMNVRLLKYESTQLHHLCDKLIAEGRLTLDELKSNVDSREEAKRILFKDGEEW